MATTLQQKLRRRRSRAFGSKPGRSKRHRTIKEAFGEVKRNKAGKRLCLFCGKQLPKRKVCWCSWDCSHQAYLQCRPGNMRAALSERDKGVCADCGRDTEKLEKELEELTRKYGLTKEGRAAYRQYVVLIYGRWALRRHLWEMNHKQAVAEGGEIWGLENVETLCIPCHQEHTKMLRKRLAWRGKGRVRSAPVPSKLYLAG